MGLLKAAGKEASELATQFDPMEAPLRFCWLMARLALEEDNRETAMQWISLPSLQIPSRSESLPPEFKVLTERPLTDKGKIQP